MRGYTKQVLADPALRTVQDHERAAAQLMLEHHTRNLVTPQHLPFTFDLRATLMHAQWVTDGRKAFVVDPSLSQALADSDPGEMRLDDVNWPEGCFYAAKRSLRTRA